MDQKLENENFDNLKNIEQKKLFQNLNFFIEIYNNNIDSSFILDDDLISNGANVII